MVAAQEPFEIALRLAVLALSGMERARGSVEIRPSFRHIQVGHLTGGSPKFH